MRRRNRTIPIHAKRQRKEISNDYQNGNTVYLQAVTMIDPASGWIKICRVPSARTDLVSNVIELAWLTRYQLPTKVIVILAEFKTIKKPTS